MDSLSISLGWQIGQCRAYGGLFWGNGQREICEKSHNDASLFRDTLLATGDFGPDLAHTLIQCAQSLARAIAIKLHQQRGMALLDLIEIHAGEGGIFWQGEIWSSLAQAFPLALTIRVHHL